MLIIYNFILIKKGKGKERFISDFSDFKEGSRGALVLCLPGFKPRGGVARRGITDTLHVEG